MFRIENAAAALLSWIHCVLLAAAVFLFAACLPVLDEAEAMTYWLNCIWLFIPVIASWVGVRKIKGLPLYLLLGAAVTASVFLLSKSLMVAGISIFFFLMRTCPRMIRGKMLEEMPGEVEEIEIWEIPIFLDYPKAVQCLLFIVVYFAIIISKRHALLITAFYVLLAEIFVCYIFASVVRMKEFITSNRRIANLPVKTMQLMQRSVLCVTLILLLLFVLPSIIYGNEPLTRLAEIELDMDVPVQNESMQASSDMSGMQEMLEMIGEQERFEWPEWVKMLMDVIMYLLCAGGVAVVAMLLYQAFRRMMQNFADGQGEDEIILLGSDETELLAGKRKGRGGIRARSPGMKIRKEYKKMLRKNMKTRPQGWETPTDLEESAGLWAGSKGKQTAGTMTQADGKKAADGPETGSGQIHRLYEKARYGREDCTREELEDFLKAKEQIRK